MNEFAMLIVPKLCRRIKVETVVNFEEPPCDRILYEYGYLRKCQGDFERPETAVDFGVFGCIRQTIRLETAGLLRK